MRKRLGFLALLMMLVILGTGCSFGKNTKVVFTTGFESNELFTIGKQSGTTEELNIYMVNTMNQYAEVYGEEILGEESEGETLLENIRQMSLARLTKVKVLILLAEEQNVYLTAQEMDSAGMAAKSYLDSLSDYERETLKVTEALITRMYQEYALAEKVYDTMIREMTPEISDDEARIVTVSQILLKTYYYDAKGTRQRYGTNARIDIHKRALAVMDRLKNGESFDVLATEYNEASETTISFGKGDKDSAYEEAAFTLGTGEISDIVETEDGYVILKCQNSYNREETDANKKKILDDYKRKSFDKTYEAFAVQQVRNMNDTLWNKTIREYDSELKTTNFWSTYDNYFHGKG